MPDILKGLLLRGDGSISLTKVGAILFTLGPIVTEVGALLSGHISAESFLTFVTDVTPLLQGFGALFGFVGFRNAVKK